ALDRRSPVYAGVPPPGEQAGEPVFRRTDRISCRVSSVRSPPCSCAFQPQRGHLGGVSTCILVGAASNSNPYDNMLVRARQRQVRSPWSLMTMHGYCATFSPCHGLPGTPTKISCCCRRVGSHLRKLHRSSSKMDRERFWCTITYNAIPISGFILLSSVAMRI